MRIILVNRCLSMFIGGGEVIDIQLAEEFKRRGYEVQFLTSRPLFERARLQGPSGFRTIFIRSPWLYDLSQWFARLPLISKFKIAALVRIVDEVAFQCAAYHWLRRNGWSATGVLTCALPVLALLLERLEGVRTATFMHGPTSAIWKPICCRLRLLLCAGTTLEQFHAESPTILRADPRIDSSVFRRLDDRKGHRAKLDLPPDAFVVLTVGRLISIKGLQTGITEFKRFSAIEPQAVWLIVGDGPLRRVLDESIRHEKLEGKIWLLGAVSRSELPAHYAAADLTFIPSLYESFSIVALESMACGVPILARAVGYLPTILTESGAGLLYGDEESARTAFKELNGSQQLRSELAESGEQFIVSRGLNSWTGIVDELERHFRNRQERTPRCA